MIIVYNEVDGEIKYTIEGIKKINKSHLESYINENEDYTFSSEKNIKPLTHFIDVKTKKIKKRKQEDVQRKINNKKNKINQTSTNKKTKIESLERRMKKLEKKIENT